MVVGVIRDALAACGISGAQRLAVEAQIADGLDAVTAVGQPAITGPVGR